MQINQKCEVIHQALGLLDAVTRGQGPEGASFHNAAELETLLLQAGPATPMTAKRKARIYGTLKRWSGRTRLCFPDVRRWDRSQSKAAGLSSVARRAKEDDGKVAPARQARRAGPFLNS